MCGIIGIFNHPEAKTRVDTALKLLESRGRDGFATMELQSGALGHTLHAIVGNVLQPLKRQGALTANCEIYNWQTLAKKHNISAENDADLILALLDKFGIKAIEELDGVFAFGYNHNNHLIIARDIVGVKPVWYSHTDGLAFCSEKKVLESLGYTTIYELNPRQYLDYDLKENRLSVINREYFKTQPVLTGDVLPKLKELIHNAVQKRIPKQKIGVLFSGGVDSTLIALLLKKAGVEFTCYTTAVEIEGMKKPDDLEAAKNAAKEHGFSLCEIKLGLDEIKDSLKRVVPLIEDSNVVKVGVALTLDAACKRASMDGCKVVFSGLGSEELFAGYQRHRDSTDLNQECLAGLRKIYERDTYRDDVVSMSHSVEMRLPFLDKELTEFALRIPPEQKIKQGTEKWILRQAALEIGLDEQTALRKKKAAQYGSNVHKALIKLGKADGKSNLSSYMKQFYPTRQVRLGVLMSSGKDSHYAMHIMTRQNYDIVCGITIESDNEDSYMFHTPNISLASLQCKSMGLPLFVQKTKGVKEEELADLEKAMTTAMKKHQIEGIITGALYSTYQRNRIEKIAEKLGLKVFSPLWHIDQETEVRQILNDGFEVWLASVACDGLDKSWLGRPLTHGDVDKLVELKKKVGVNIAGEGGEYETMVLNSPMFSSKIVLDDFEIVEESEHVARLNVNSARLNN